MPPTNDGSSKTIKRVKMASKDTLYEEKPGRFDWNKVEELVAIPMMNTHVTEAKKMIKEANSASLSKCRVKVGILKGDLCLRIKYGRDSYFGDGDVLLVRRFQDATKDVKQSSKSKNQGALKVSRVTPVVSTDWWYDTLNEAPDTYKVGELLAVITRADPKSVKSHKEIEKVYRDLQGRLGKVAREYTTKNDQVILNKLAANLQSTWDAFMDGAATDDENTRRAINSIKDFPRQVVDDFLGEFTFTSEKKKLDRLMKNGLWDEATEQLKLAIQWTQKTKSIINLSPTEYSRMRADMAKKHQCSVDDLPTSPPAFAKEEAKLNQILKELKEIGEQLKLHKSNETPETSNPKLGEDVKRFDRELESLKQEFVETAGLTKTALFIAETESKGKPTSTNATNWDSRPTWAKGLDKYGLYDAAQTRLNQLPDKLKTFKQELEQAIADSKTGSDSQSAADKKSAKALEGVLSASRKMEPLRNKIEKDLASFSTFVDAKNRAAGKYAVDAETAAKTAESIKAELGKLRQKLVDSPTAGLRKEARNTLLSQITELQKLAGKFSLNSVLLNENKYSSESKKVADALKTINSVLDYAKERNREFDTLTWRMMEEASKKELAERQKLIKNSLEPEVQKLADFVKTIAELDGHVQEAAKNHRFAKSKGEEDAADGYREIIVNAYDKLGEIQRKSIAHFQAVEAADARVTSMLEHEELAESDFASLWKPFKAAATKIRDVAKERTDQVEKYRSAFKVFDKRLIQYLKETS